MNFQYIPTLTPLRVMVVDPLSASSQLTISKMLSGIVFGPTQLLDMILLCYTNDMPEAKQYVQELTGCAFPCFNSIRATSDLPSISDADVFCFISNLKNPNLLNFEDMDSLTTFDTMYLILKVAIGLGKKTPQTEEAEKRKSQKPRNDISPIVVCDGIVVLDILNSFSVNLPPDILFCSTPLRSITKTVLSDYLKVECYEINNVQIWGANDRVFHVEIEKPYLKYDDHALKNKGVCEWDGVRRKRLEELGFDHTDFNASFMKKEFIEKILLSATKNPYGCIFKAAEMSKTIRYIWASRYQDESNKTSLGVISDGSVGTIKGLPYVLPLIFDKGKWKVNEINWEKSHVMREIQRVNEAAKERHEKLMAYCKKFLKVHFIGQDLVSTVDITHSSSSSFRF